MAEFQAKTFNKNEINGGQRFNEGDGISAGAINAPIEASLLMQSLATNQPNIEKANNVGTPNVSIETMPDGSPRFKFENLKGEKGNKGIKIDYDGEFLYIAELE